jgi:RsiW-degrading membrane proteinase PrsW (M82 family)
VAVIPGLLLLLYFNARQEYHLSADIVWNSVLLGAAISILAIVIELPLDFFFQQIEQPERRGVLRAFVGTALPEELCKYLVVYWIALRHEDYERPVDALVLAVAVALGFATFENLLYLVRSDDWSRTAVARAMTAVPSHVINAMLMGYFLGRAQLSRHRAGLFRVLALLAPTLNHGAYDLPLFVIDGLNRSGSGAPVLPLILAFAVIIGFGSLLALAAWYDLLERDAADAASQNAPYVIRRLPPGLQRLEARFWLLVGSVLAVGSVSMALAGFITPIQGGSRWSQLYPQYFLLASSTLPCLFGCAMIGHGWGQWMKGEAEARAKDPG